MKKHLDYPQTLWSICPLSNSTEKQWAADKFWYIYKTYQKFSKRLPPHCRSATNEIHDFLKVYLLHLLQEMFSQKWSVRDEYRRVFWQRVPILAQSHYDQLRALESFACKAKLPNARLTAPESALSEANSEQRSAVIIFQATNTLHYQIQLVATIKFNSWHRRPSRPHFQTFQSRNHLEYGRERDRSRKWNTRIGL